MQYLTSNHQTPPQHAQYNGMLYPTAPIIAQGNTAMLATLGIYPHHTNSAPAPLGTQWELVDGEYHEVPIGTADEIQAALDAQAAAAHEFYLDALECTRLQGKLALIQAGLWTQYEALIAAMLPSMTPDQRVFVEDAQVWKYRDPVLQMFASAIDGLDEDSLVTLFETARTL